MIGLLSGEEIMTIYLFHLILERNGRTDRQNCYINIARQYADAHDKSKL